MPGRGQIHHFKSLAQMNKEIKRQEKRGFEPVHGYGLKPGHYKIGNPIGPGGYPVDEDTKFVLEFRRKKTQGSRQRFHL